MQARRCLPAIRTWWQTRSHSVFLHEGTIGPCQSCCDTEPLKQESHDVRWVTGRVSREIPYNAMIQTQSRKLPVFYVQKLPIQIILLIHSTHPWRNSTFPVGSMELEKQNATTIKAAYQMHKGFKILKESMLHLLKNPYYLWTFHLLACL